MPVTTSAPSRATAAFAERVRADFPALTRQVRGRPLVYLDNGATAHKPRAVLEAMERFHTGYNSNIHRGVHLLSQEATDAYEAARRTVAGFIGASQPEEIVFVRGATEAINLVANGLSRIHFSEGDEIVLSVMEHHANIVPWQLLAEPLGVTLRVTPILPDGSLDLEAFERLLGPRTRLVTLVHVSNALGTINPAEKLCALARARGIPVLLDGCQAVPHLPVDVRALGCDFYVFSGHKLFGPTGIGVLWARREWLEKLPPYQGGGDMIKVVSFKGTTFAEPPAKFEAGTPHIAGAIGLAAAMDYVRALGDEPTAHEAALAAHARAVLSDIEGVRIVGTAREKVPVFSFTVEGAHPHDVGTLLDQAGIAVRTGHHCAMPLMEHLGIPGTSRASLAFYNTFDEIDQLGRALGRVARMFG